MQRKQTRRGLTLVELVIAMVILFFACMALLKYFDNSIRIELRSKDRTTGAKLAQKIMEEQIYNSLDDIIELPFTPVPGNSHYQYRIMTNGIYIDDPSIPNYRTFVKEIRTIVRGPLDSSGQTISRTQVVTLKVWRPNHSPTAIGDRRLPGCLEREGGIQ